MLNVQFGKGPGHAVAAMIYVKSYIEGKRMKFNLAVCIEQSGTSCSNKQDRL